MHEEGRQVLVHLYLTASPAASINGNGFSEPLSQRSPTTGLLRASRRTYGLGPVYFYIVSLLRLSCRGHMY